MRDEQGRKGVVLSSNEHTASVFVYDKQERDIISLIAGDRHGLLIVSDKPAGGNEVTLSASEGRTSVSISDKQGRGVISLYASKIGNGISIADQQGEQTIGLQSTNIYDADQSPRSWISIKSPHNESSIGLWATKVPGNFILINDGQGNIVWQAPEGLLEPGGERLPQGIKPLFLSR